jgi:hypothetical protein
MALTRRLTMSGAMLAAMWPGRPALAQVSPALYQATAIVTGTDMRQRPLGFARCLVEVLIKLTGQPDLASNPAVTSLADRAEAFVASYAYVDPRAALLHHDDQGTYDRSYELTVVFDPTKIDAALNELGIPLWRGSRPLLTPIILVRDKDLTPFLLSAENPRGADMRQAILRLAAEAGIGVHFPTEADLAAWEVELIGFPAPLGDPTPGLLQITGSMSWSVHALGWVGVWRVRLNGIEHAWEVSGVGFDQAFANMVRGSVELAAGTGTP